MGISPYDQVLRAAERLTPQEQEALIAHLRAQSTVSSSDRGVLLREQIVAEFEQRKAAGAFEQVESLRDKYANPAIDHLSDDELRQQIHEAATEWKKDLDEQLGND